MTFLNKVLFPVFWTPAHGIFYPNPCYGSHIIQAEWLSGLCQRPKASVTSLAGVQDPFLSFMLTSYTKNCFLYFQYLHMVSFSIIHAIDLKTYRQDGREDWGAGFRHQSLQWHGFESYSCHFANIPKESIVSIILNTYTWCHLQFSMLLTKNIQEGWPIVMKRWFMGNSHFGGVGSIPLPVILLTFLYKVLFPLFLTPTHGIFYYYPCYSPHNIQVGWPSGLRRWL